MKSKTTSQGKDIEEIIKRTIEQNVLYSPNDKIFVEADLEDGYMIEVKYCPKNANPGIDLNNYWDLVEYSNADGGYHPYVTHFALEINGIDEFNPKCPKGHLVGGIFEVATNMQGQGFGKKMLNLAEEIGRALGIGSIRYYLIGGESDPEFLRHNGYLIRKSCAMKILSSNE